MVQACTNNSKTGSWVKSTPMECKYLQTDLNFKKKGIPSFYPFFYKNPKNSTYFELLRNILTNKCTMKKNQHREVTMGIIWNNFWINWWSLRCSNKLKTVTQAVWTIMGKCFLGFLQPIRTKLLKTLKQLTNQKLPIIVHKLF